MPVTAASTSRSTPSDPRPGQHSGFTDISIVLAGSRRATGDVEAVRLMPSAAGRRRVAQGRRLDGREADARAFDGQTLIMHRNFRSDVWDLW